jgi:hypothetical protein
VSTDSSTSRLNLLFTPALKINDHRRAPTPRDDPRHLLVAIIHLLMLRPSGYEGEIAWGELLTLLAVF